MEIQERKSGKIYALSSTTSVPEWLGERARRNLAKSDSAFRHRITLLQDLEMPVSSNKVRQSPDGRFLIVGGTYSPRIRCYELSEMSMKFERYLDSEVVDIQILSEDYGKLAILGADRSVSFHAPYGNHSVIRLPTFGRAMAYEKTTLICWLLVLVNEFLPELHLLVVKQWVKCIDSIWTKDDSLNRTTLHQLLDRRKV